MKTVKRIPLMMMRARSLHGPFFGKFAKSSKKVARKLAHSAGNFITPKV
jgi:hypothetical protein